MSTIRLASLARRALITCACLWATSAAAGSPKPPEPDPMRAQLVLIRSSSYFGGWVSAKVDIDGKTVVKIANGRYTVIPIEPGAHRISINLGIGGVDGELNAEAGNQYFWQFTTETENVPDGKEVTWLIRVVTPEAAQPLMSACKYQPMPSARKKK